jgi:predicted AlkP superfamily pyrophosphatase or phosphodiesterase
VSVDSNITYNIPEIWDPEHPEDRITGSRPYATPGLIDDVERYATGRLDSNSMSEEYLSLDEQSGRAAAYIFSSRRPAFLAVHFACVDGAEHDYGREGDSVRLALASVDRAIGDVLESIRRSGLRDSTTVLIVGDHGFSTIHTVFRPNMLIREVPARFIAAGGSAFLYRVSDAPKGEGPGNTNRTNNTNRSNASNADILKSVRRALDSLPADKRKLFRIIERPELDRMGADSSAILALAATPGTVFSGAVVSAKTTNQGPGTAIQQSPMKDIFFPTTGGHHGYDPNIPEMYTGFIAVGVGIKKGGMIKELCVTDIAPLIARLLGIEFPCPDGKLIPGILAE